MCYDFLPQYVAIGGQIVVITVASLWYLESKGKDRDWFPEARLAITLIVALPALFLQFCKFGII